MTSEPNTIPVPKQEEPSLQSRLQAHNVPVDGSDFDIDIVIIDEDGHPVRRLAEFGSTVVAWNFESVPGPDFDHHGNEDFTFDDGDDQGPETDSKGQMTRPQIGLDLDDEDSDEDSDEDDEDDEYEGPENFRELVLVHQITGAAFQELNRYVFGVQERPETAVKITYYAETKDGKGQTKKHPIFVHVFYGVFYVPEDMGGNRTLDGGKQGPLLLQTRMEVLGSRLYLDPNDGDTMSQVLQEYAGQGAH